MATDVSASKYINTSGGGNLQNAECSVCLRLQWNLDLTKSLGTSRICSFNGGFVKWRVRYFENLDITNLRGNDQKVRYIEVIVNDRFVTQVTSVEIL